MICELSHFNQTVGASPLLLQMSKGRILLPPAFCVPYLNVLVSKTISTLPASHRCELESRPVSNSQASSSAIA